MKYWVFTFKIKFISILIFFLCTHYIAIGKNYYVDCNSTKKGKGTITSPFKTIQEAALIMHPGDNCFIREGVYPETIVPLNSGKYEAPITFQPWNQNDKVQITGLNHIKSGEWVFHEKSYYKVKVNLNLDHENQVFKDDKMMHLAGWPNQGDDLLTPVLSDMGKGTTKNFIIDNSLPDYDYTDACVWIHAPKYWSNWTTNVVEFGEEYLKIINNAPFAGGPNQHVATYNAQYRIFGIFDALDSENEWYYDKKDKILYILANKNMIPPDNIRYKKRMYALDLRNRSHIIINNLEIFGATIITDEKSNHILLDKMRILYPYHSSQANNLYGNQTDKGVVLKGKNCIIQNSEIGYSSGCGVVLDGEYNKVINCYIHDTDYIGTYASSIQLNGKGNTISHCTLTRSGRAVISYGGMYQALIQFNDLSYSGMLTSDLGITYGNVIEGGNSEIRYNWLHDNKDDNLDVGLYFDHGTQNIISHHNVIWGIGKFGLVINHYGYFHLIYNNTFVSEQIGFRSFWGNKYSPDLYGCRFMNNIFSGYAEINADNYFWSNNITQFTELIENKYLKHNSIAIDRAFPIERITTKFTGLLPDIGAYEYNGENWIPGHNFDCYPQIDTTRSLPLHRNMLRNSAFEHEDHLSPWIVEQGKVNIIEEIKNQTTPDTANVRMGKYSIKLEQGAKISQTIIGLVPNAWYEFSGFLKVEKNGCGYIGISDNADMEQKSTFFTGKKLNTSISDWNRALVRFKTDLNNTSVKVYVKNDSESKKNVFVDDLGLILIE